MWHRIWLFKYNPCKASYIIACGHNKWPCHRQLLCVSISMRSGQLVLLSCIHSNCPAPAQASMRHTRTCIVYIDNWGYRMRNEADLANSLGSTSGGGDDVGSSSPPTPPVLLGGAIYSFLGGSGGMHSGHQTLLNAKLLVNNLRMKQTYSIRIQCPVSEQHSCRWT